ncbi:MAG TPA: universal stress protein [Gammaproteobacteria bacterium]
MDEPTLERVLVGIRPRGEALPVAAMHARYLAECAGAEIELVTSIFDADIAARLGAGDATAAAAQAGMMQNEQRALDRLAQSLRDWGVRVRAQVLWDRPVHEALLREAERWNADIVVLGEHEPRVGLHWRLADADWELARRSPRPVLLARDPDFEGYRTVLAAVDPLHLHSEPSGLDRAVLRHARALARCLGAELRVVHAFPDPEEFALASAVEVEPGVFYGTENIEDVHRKAVQQLVSAFGVPPERVDLRPGRPADAITAVARERGAKLIVLGAVQRSRPAQALIGSTAEAVATEAECDVLLVPAPWAAER